MNEKLLQYIWQFRYYDATRLATTSGDQIRVIHPGAINHHQGPDFINARIKIGNTLWVGNVEIHLLASQWEKHGHTNDAHYGNVVLHVVLIEDRKLDLPFATVELRSRISRQLLSMYSDLMAGKEGIACQKLIAYVKPLTILKWKERLLAGRMEQKTRFIEHHLQLTRYHWEETSLRVLITCFGNKVNADAFEQIAAGIPISVFQKNRFNLFSTEALLLGQAGLLEKDFASSYPAALKKEYCYLKSKYRLQQHPVLLHFLRMRPANFPTIRLAQLAALIVKVDSFFHFIAEAKTLKELIAFFDVSAGEYWEEHYILEDEASRKLPKRTGRPMINSIIINAVVPLLFAYGKHRDSNACKEKAMQWLMELPGEKNSITGIFENLGIGNNCAFDSQAYLQLKNNYCDDHRCLQCGIGNALFKMATSSDTLLTSLPQGEGSSPQGNDFPPAEAIPFLNP